MNAGTFSSHDNIDCGRPTIQCFARTLAAKRIKKSQPRNGAVEIFAPVPAGIRCVDVSVANRPVTTAEESPELRDKYALPQRQKIK